MEDCQWIQKTGPSPQFLFFNPLKIRRFDTLPALSSSFHDGRFFGWIRRQVLSSP